jgi:O-antigen ligase
MDNSAIPQRLKTLSLAGAGLLLAILIGLNIGNGDYVPLILGGAVVAVGCLALFTGRLYWVLTIASSFLGGTFPILGGSFTPFQVLIVIGIAKFLIEDVVFRRARLVKLERFDKFLIAGFMGVLTLHGIHDRFGMRFLGSSVWGGRNYINVYVGFAAFLVVQSVPMKTKIWGKLPYFVLAVTAFDLFIAVITTIFPASIYKIYPFYSAVSLAGLQEVVTGDMGETARVGAFGFVGFSLIVLALSWVSLRKILHPSNFFPLLALAGGFIGVLVSSFRSFVAHSVVAFFLAGIRDLKWGVLLLMPAIGVLLLGISILNSEFVPLPKQVQRSLSFLPGKWDNGMKRDAISSNEFRGRVWTIWIREYFPVHPWIGRGFGFRNQWAELSVYKYDPYEDVQMVEVGNIHNGFFASLDTFGVIGTIFFVVWNVRLLTRALKIPFRRGDPAGTALRFLALYLAVSIISFWMSAQNVGSFLPQEFALAGVFLRLRGDRISALDSISPALSTPQIAPGSKLVLAGNDPHS